MSITITIQVPQALAQAIQDVNFNLAFVDDSIEANLAEITSSIVEALKSLPQDKISSPPSPYSNSLAFSTTSRSFSAISTSSSSSSDSTDSRLRIHIYNDYDVFVNDTLGIIYQIPVTGNTTVSELQAKVARASGTTSTTNQCLVWRGYALNQSTAPLASYGLGPDSEIQLRRRKSEDLGDGPKYQGICVSNPEAPRSPRRRTELKIKNSLGWY